MTPPPPAPATDYGESDCRLCHCCLDAPDRHGEILQTWVDRALKAEQERDAIQETLTAVEYEVAIVYCHITGSRISKCNTLASVVISEADELAQKDIDEAVAEAESRADQLAAERDRWKMAYENLTSRVIGADREVDDD